MPKIKKTNKATTNFYDHKGNYKRSMPLMTLLQWVETGNLNPGQCLLIGDMKGDYTSHRETIWIGHATPYIQPTENDGGIGWDYDDPMMKKYLLEVYEN